MRYCARSRFFFKIHGLKVCFRKDVVSNACVLSDGVYRADSKAVLRAEGSHGLQHEAGEALRLKEGPSKVVLLLKPTCCETAGSAETEGLSCPHPGLDSSFLLLYLSSDNCCPVAMLHVGVLQVPTSAAWVAARSGET